MAQGRPDLNIKQVELQNAMKICINQLIDHSGVPMARELRYAKFYEIMKIFLVKVAHVITDKDFTL